MIKKISLVLILVIGLSLPVFSLPPVTHVKTVLKTTNENSLYDIGFSSTAVNQYSDIPTYLPYDVYELKEYYATDSSTGKRYLIASSKNPSCLELYVYWRILSYNTVNLTLDVSGPLKAGNNLLNWTITWNYKGADGSVTAKKIDSSSGSIVPENVASCVPSQVYQGQGGCVRLTMETEGLMEKVISEPYVGSLILGISVV